MRAAIRAARKQPDQPAVDCAEQQLSGISSLAGACDVLEDPTELWAAEVARERQTRRITQTILPSVCCQSSTDLVCACVLPDECVMNWPAGLSIPDDGCFTLVRYADGSKTFGAYPRIAERSRDDLGRVVPDLERIVLNPTRSRKDLFVLFLGEPYN